MIKLKKNYVSFIAGSRSNPCLAAGKSEEETKNDYISNVKQFLVEAAASA